MSLSMTRKEAIERVKAATKPHVGSINTGHDEALVDALAALGVIHLNEVHWVTCECQPGDKCANGDQTITIHDTHRCRIVRRHGFKLHNISGV